MKKCVLTKTNEDLMYERLFKVESQLVDGNAAKRVLEPARRCGAIPQGFGNQEAVHLVPQGAQSGGCLLPRCSQSE